MKHLIATAIIQSGIIVGCVVLVSTTLQFFLFSFVCLLFVRLFYLMPVWPWGSVIATFQYFCHCHFSVFLLLFLYLVLVQLVRLPKLQFLLLVSLSELLALAFLLSLRKWPVPGVVCVAELSVKIDNGTFTWDRDAPDTISKYVIVPCTDMSATHRSLHLSWKSCGETASIPNLPLPPPPPPPLPAPISFDWNAYLLTVGAITVAVSVTKHSN